MTAPTQPSSAAELATYIDHTLLKPEATPADVEALVVEALGLGVFSVCVSPSMLPVSVPEDSELKVATVCGFPSGKHEAEIKAREAALAAERGADEVDMVIDLGHAKAARFDLVESEIRAVREATPASVILKVIIESAALSDEEIVATCRAAEAAGADFVKTSTGFHPAGGATVHAVRLMAQTVGARLGVKASGGIRTLAQAREMIGAGATRLGLSGSAAILAEWDGPVAETRADAEGSEY
ncbi:deoxyribose-phosphate aldolase [Lysinibacter sp. HNR]|uniref:deoxyribose-phosphate aldolase n=1 Tax=Lysinibacter sp. HNR TaxID=3031408 RepID=UPI002435A173|nr:deoxyribose-phosphate aldolase [Lysinibacter sp. HNR]WGD36494.1 deoxyribose-phosphate aldolase [Lysinibacter sp. HNR]